MSVSEADLSEALVFFIQLAAERHASSGDGMDPRIYRELAAAEATEAVLKRVVTTLRNHRQRRQETVQLLRAIRCADELVKVLRARKSFPNSCVRTTVEVAREHGIELTDVRAEAITRAAARQHGESSDRAPRIVNAILGARVSASRIKSVRALLSGRAREVSGKIKNREQLVIAYYEGTGLTALVEHVLRLLGSEYPKAAAAAIAAWKQEMAFVPRMPHPPAEGAPARG